MANVLHQHIEFQPRPVAHAPSPFGFGFGLGSSSSPMSQNLWGTTSTATPGHTNPAAFHQLASSMAQSASNSNKALKRRLEHEDDEDSGGHASRRSMSRDESMDRSPTPERPRRAVPKRARFAQGSESSSKGHSPSKGGDSSATDDGDEVDVGVLLASLPSQSLLPLLVSLVKEKPELKATIVNLIPRPTLEAVGQALSQASRKLREAYPYHNNTGLSPSSIFAPQRLGHSSEGALVGQSGMRESYIISRLGPHVTEFVSCWLTYLPYFTCVTSTTSNPTGTSTTAGAAQTISQPGQQKEKAHPSESFMFLLTVTKHILSQPPLTVNELCRVLLPRLAEEWKTWVNRIDETVKMGGMFGRDMVSSWEHGLDELAECKVPEVARVMRGVRDGWISRVGWLVGRTLQHAMDV